MSRLAPESGTASFVRQEKEEGGSEMCSALTRATSEMTQVGCAGRDGRSHLERHGVRERRQDTLLGEADAELALQQARQVRRLGALGRAEQAHDAAALDLLALVALDLRDLAQLLERALRAARPRSCARDWRSGARAGGPKTAAPLLWRAQIPGPRPFANLHDVGANRALP